MRKFREYLEEHMHAPTYQLDSDIRARCEDPESEVSGKPMREFQRFLLVTQWLSETD